MRSCSWSIIAVVIVLVIVNLVITIRKNPDDSVKINSNIPKIIKEPTTNSNLPAQDKPITLPTASKSNNALVNTPRTAKPTPKTRSAENLLFAKTKMSWSDFTSSPVKENFIVDSHTSLPLPGTEKLTVCSADIESKLAAPMLNAEKMKWCQWALSSSGGKVVVGKSWGKLDNMQKRTFDAYNCNSVAKDGKNPSCDDSWGDKHMKDWKRSKYDKLSCLPEKSSEMNCYRNDNKDVYCSLHNVQFNFAKFKKYERQGTTPSKEFKQDFLSMDCNNNKIEEEFPFNHLFSPQLSSSQCDYVYNGTLLLYSHDDIRNLGHTLNDVFNVWVMLWIEGVARYANSIDFLNIDTFKKGHNFDDKPNKFFLSYYKNFNSILEGNQFSDKTLCVKKVMVQPVPPKFFIWESWFIDLPCSFTGPSALYHRWNLHVRHSYGLLGDGIDTRGVKELHSNPLITNDKLRILVIVRNEKTNLWGSSRTSRNYLNTPEIERGLQEALEMNRDWMPNKQAELIMLDMNTLEFEEQIKLLSQVSIVIGTHGAGIASTMHMAIGTRYCCGVIEIYPKGEFTPIRGHGNMVRKMGIRYDRIDVEQKDSRGDGVMVPVKSLATAMLKMIQNVVANSSCALPSVIHDPYLEKL